MWRDLPRERSERITDQAITEKYESGEQRIVTESNREKLPNFVNALQRPGYMVIRPTYQRRQRWHKRRQSRLIESFIVNIPVPPLFVYEQGLNSYEVMDGQQRITALKDFYEGRLRLTGLELWPELNGRTYATLPAKIRAGIDRRTISWIVVLHESSATQEEAQLIKQLVFERLNTGGVKLGAQEIRNAIYQGPLNELLLELSREDNFADAWGIPRRTANEESDPPEPLLLNRLYREMGDAELVLRFFALRHVDNFRRGMSGFLSLYMIRSKDFGERDLEILADLFRETIGLATDLYEDNVFRTFDPVTNSWSTRSQEAFYDAVMVGLSRHLSAREAILERRQEILDRTQALFLLHPEGTFTGRANTKNDIKERIRLYEDMLRRTIEG